MAFENIGIGGILSFDSKGAVANMSMAQRAFASLGRSAQGVQAGFSKVGAGLGGIFGGLATIGTAGIAGVGFGITKWIKSGMDFNKEMETSEIAIATILSTVKKTPLATEMVTAKQAMMDLNKVAAEAPGELTDIVGIFQKMAGPMTVGKASMEEMYAATKGTAILAGALKRPFNDVGSAMSKLASGQMELGSDVHQYLKSFGLLTETTKEWKELLPEQRVKRIGEMLSNFGASGEAVGKTMDAQASTMASNLKMLAGGFTRQLFGKMTTGLGSFNEAFLSNQKGWLDKIEEIGSMFGDGLAFVIANAKGAIMDVVHVVQKLHDKFDGLGAGINSGMLKPIAAIVVKVTTIALAFSPVIAVVGFLGTKIMALASMASGLLTIFTSLVIPFAPFILAAGALFLLFRKDGEPAMATFTRGLKYIQEVGGNIWKSIQPGIGSLISAFYIAKEAATNMWFAIQPGLASLRSAITGIVAFASQVFASVFNLMSQAVTAVTLVWYAIQPGVSAVFNAIMGFIDVIVQGMNYLWPKVMAVIAPIWTVILEIGMALGQVFGKLMSFMAPLIDGMTWLWKNVLMPFAGFVLDVLGPVVTTAFEAMGAVIGVVLGIIGKVIDGMKWLAEKAGAIVSAVGDAAGAAASSVGSAMDYMTGKVKKVEAATIDISPEMETINQTDAAITRNDTNISDASIEAKQPDLAVNLKLDQKSTMCVNGRNLAVAQGEYETEVAERSGFNRTPWQTSRVQISGVKP